MASWCHDSYIQSFIMRDLDNRLDVYRECLSGVFQEIDVNIILVSWTG